MDFKQKVRKKILYFCSRVKNLPKTIFWEWNYYRTLFGKYNKSRYSKELAYLHKKGKSQKGRPLVFPYNFYERYDRRIDEVYLSDDEKMLYVKQDTKKLYFPGTSREWVAKKICNLRIEQDPNSPHRYFSENFRPKANEVFIDIGAAEGKEALEVIEDVKAEVLIESSDGWIKVLKKTFEPWKDKVQIIRAFVSDCDTDGNIALDSIMEDDTDYFLKLDVEGAEMKVLKGAEKRLKKGGIRCVVCTYHKENDQKELYDYLSSLGYICSFSEGYCLNYSLEFRAVNRRPPYFRRGVIRAYKGRDNS